MVSDLLVLSAAGCRDQATRSRPILDEGGKTRQTEEPFGGNLYRQEKRDRMTTKQDAGAEKSFCPTTTLTRRTGSAGVDHWWELIEYIWEVLPRLRSACVVDGMIQGFTQAEICEALVTEACPDPSVQLQVLQLLGILLDQGEGAPPVLDIYPEGTLDTLTFLLWDEDIPPSAETMKELLADWFTACQASTSEERLRRNAERLTFAWRVSEGLNPSTGVVRRPPLGCLPETDEVELMLARLRFALEQPRSPEYRAELESAYAEWERVRQEREALKMRAAFRQKPPQTRKARAA